LNNLIFWIALVPAVIAAAVIYLLVSHSRLKRKVAALERVLAAQPTAPRDTDLPDAAPSAADAKTTAATGPWQSPVAEPATASAPDAAPLRAVVFNRANIDRARQWLGKTGFWPSRRCRWRWPGFFWFSTGSKTAC
jgi:hypothetical protein